MNDTSESSTFCKYQYFSFDTLHVTACPYVGEQSIQSAKSSQMLRKRSSTSKPNEGELYYYKNNYLTLEVN